MVVTSLDAKSKLEAEGLHVSANNPESLWIAGTVREMGNGINLSEDACSLICKTGRWTAIFPAAGLFTYEVPGALPDLVSLISEVYAEYRRAGNAFKDAFEQVVGDPELYVVGRSAARV